jgi:hypothetical protein
MNFKAPYPPLCHCLNLFQSFSSGQLMYHIVKYTFFNQPNIPLIWKYITVLTWYYFLHLDIVEIAASFGIIFCPFIFCNKTCFTNVFDRVCSVMAYDLDWLELACNRFCWCNFVIVMIRVPTPNAFLFSLSNFLLFSLWQLCVALLCVCVHSPADNLFLS